MKLDILTFPNEKLHEISQDIEIFDDSLKTLAENMLDTMYDAPGVGLAAIQVGEPIRLIVMDVDYDLEEKEDGSYEITNKNPRVFVNPQILKKSGKTIYKEGCLSVPGVYEEVSRAHKIEVHFKDLEGNDHLLKAGYGDKDQQEEVLLSVCLQHECDHLDGKLFIDRLSPIKRDFTKKRILKELKTLEPV